MLETTHFLKELSDIAKTIDGPIEYIKYDYTTFRKAFYNAIIREFNNKENFYPGFELSLKSFNIEFDRENNAYLNAYNPVTKNNLTILSDDIFYKSGLPRGIKMTESAFANIVLDEERKLYRELAKNPNNTPFLINEYLLEDALKPIYKAKVEDIKNYITSREEYRRKSIEIKRNMDLGSITFVENDMPQVKRSGVSNSLGIEVERKTEEMPLKDRLDILDKYPFEFKSDDVSGFSKDGVHASSYKVRVYNVKPKTVVVMEPFEDNKSIKIRYVDMDIPKLRATGKVENIDIENSLQSIIQESLQFNRSEISEHDDMTRHNHKGIKNYDALMKYLLEGVDEGIPLSSKNNIDSAMKTK